ncbi:MAG: hypothetical protein IKW90_12140 [Lachnospiraceae bacterium]|nr:hypothetical protein [Lachnospiraceae bacterium]
MSNNKDQKTSLLCIGIGLGMCIAVILLFSFWYVYVDMAANEEWIDYHCGDYI